MRDLVTAVKLLREARECIDLWFENDRNLEALDIAAGNIEYAIEELIEKNSQNL